MLSAAYLVSLSQTGPAGIGTSSINVFWIKADAGTSSSVNGAAISAWNDQSGNGINVTQTVSSQQPSFATNVINGFPAVQFDNVTTTNDKMIGPDSPILDNTAGYSFFTVTRPQSLDGNARVIVSKRTTVSVDQSFMLFYYTGNKLAIDIQTTDNRFFTNATLSNNTNYILDIIYDGSLATSSRVAVYSEETLDKTATETASFVPDNASPLILGTTDATDPRPYGGYIAEVIIYREALVPAQRIIVNNYLSAKYDIALSANDKYNGDDALQGHYDFEVAGVGMESTGSNPSFSPSVSGGLGIAVNSGFNAGDYILAGHAVMVNSQTTTDVGGMTGTNNARWLRIWYLDVTNSSTALNTDIEFDMSDGGAPFAGPTTANNYVLLYRSGLTGNWTEMTTASAISGDRILFNGITLNNDGYYTIGTKNYIVSTLPIELVNFDAKVNGSKVDLTWRTASERNNAYFTVEKTIDGVNFETVEIHKGAGNNSTLKTYASVDKHPYEGLSYYRLRQTDMNKTVSYSPFVSIEYLTDDTKISIYPNPSEGLLNIRSKIFLLNSAEVTIEDLEGKSLYSKSFDAVKNREVLIVDWQNKTGAGSYLVKVTSGTTRFIQKIIFK